MRDNSDKEFYQYDHVLSGVIIFDYDLIRYQNRRAIAILGVDTIDDLLEIFGLSHCADINLGNETIVTINSKNYNSVINLVTKDDNSQFILSFHPVICSDESINDLFDKIDTGVLLVHRDMHIIVKTNRKAEKILGYSHKDLKGQEVTSIFKENSRIFPDINDTSITALLTNTSQQESSIDIVGLCKDGSERVVSVISKPKADGQCVYLILQDVTENYYINKESLEKDEIHKTLIDYSNDAMEIHEIESIELPNIKAKLISRNDKMNFIAASNPKGLILNIEDVKAITQEYQPDGVLSLDYLARHHSELVKYNKHRIKIRFSVNSQNYDINLSSHIITRNDKRLLIRIAKDVTSELVQEKIIKRQLKDLNEKNDELVKYIDSNLQLENYAYIASHDLKAPLRSVMSFTQLLKGNLGPSIGEKNLQFIDIILNSSSNLMMLIDDLLSYSRINTQSMTFEVIDLDELISKLVIEFEQDILRCNGKIVFPDLPKRIIGDKTRIRQLFQNLIMNALKFSKSDTPLLINVNYWDEPNHHRIEVSDNGIGIEENYLESIFLMFKKLHSENKYKGTGIGLSICKKIIEQHHGLIYAKSTIGVGTSFTFTISKGLT